MRGYSPRIWREVHSDDRRTFPWVTRNIFPRKEGHSQVYADLLASRGNGPVYHVGLLLSKSGLKPLLFVNELTLFERRLQLVGSVLDFKLDRTTGTHFYSAIHFALPDIAPWADL